MKSVLYQEHFLRDIAQMSFCKYNIDTVKPRPQLGLMQSINSSSNLGLVVSRIFSTLNYSRIIDIEPGVSLPAWQETTKGFVLLKQMIHYIIVFFCVYRFCCNCLCILRPEY